MGTRPMGAAIAAAALTVIAGCGPQCEDFNVVLGTQAEVDALRSCETLENVTIQMGIDVTEIDWPNLVDARGIQADANADLERISLPRLRSLGAMGFSIDDDPNLRTIDVGSLQRTEIFVLHELPALEAIDLPEMDDLGRGGRVEVVGATRLSAPNLTNDFETIVIGRNPNLGEIAMPLLEAAGRIEVRDNPALERIDLDAARGIATLFVECNCALTEVRLSALTSGTCDLDGNPTLEAAGVHTSHTCAFGDTACATCD